MVALGVDMFDCVAPDAAGAHRHGDDPAGAPARCGAPPTATTCAARRRLPLPRLPRFSRAYLRHLIAAGEILGHRLLSLHNITHLSALMAAARAAIAAGRFAAFRRRGARLGLRRRATPPARRRSRGRKRRIPGTLGRRG